MAGDVPFFARPRIVLWQGTEADTGRPVWLLDLVDPEGRITVDLVYSLAEATAAADEWRAYGLPIYHGSGR